MAKAVNKGKKPAAVKKKEKKEKVEMVKVPLKDYIRLKPDDFENPNIAVLFKLQDGSSHTKGTELQVSNLIAKSMKSFDHIRKQIYDAVQLYEELTTLEDDIRYLNGLA